MNDVNDCRIFLLPPAYDKPTAPLGVSTSVFATTPCRGLSLSRYTSSRLYSQASMHTFTKSARAKIIAASI